MIVAQAAAQLLEVISSRETAGTPLQCEQLQLLHSLISQGIDPWFMLSVMHWYIVSFLDYVSAACSEKWFANETDVLMATSEIQYPGS